MVKVLVAVASLMVLIAIGYSVRFVVAISRGGDSVHTSFHLESRLGEGGHKALEELLLREFATKCRKRNEAEKCIYWNVEDSAGKWVMVEVKVRSEIQRITLFSSPEYRWFLSGAEANSLHMKLDEEISSEFEEKISKRKHSIVG